MSYSIAHIATIIGAKALTPLDEEPIIAHLLLDSRNPVYLSHSLFFALRGSRHDGHDYLEDLYKAGLRYFVVSKDVAVDNFPQARFLLVPNTLNALQTLAIFHRSQFSIPVIGITGSNGKTIVKEWLFQLLEADYSIVRSPKSYNSQIGVPLSVWQMAAGHELGIFEAGISQTGEMELLTPIIQCTIGVFTNIGAAHSEGFASEEEKIHEKIKLFSTAQTLIYCSDRPLVRKAMETLKGKINFRWSTNGSEAELQISDRKMDGEQVQITGTYQGQQQQVSIPFTDEASIENAIHCWALLLYFGYPIQVIRQRLSHLEPLGMRLELKTGINGCVLVNDSYNSDLQALHLALNFLEQQSPQQKRHLILSDILQSGVQAQLLYQRVAQLLEEKKINRLTGIGTDIQHLDLLLPTSISRRFFPDTATFLAQFRNENYQQEAILIKGARVFGFEQIANRLAAKVHQTVLEINLSAMVHNLNVYNGYLNPDTKLMVMVKASAYGSGSHEVARMLEYQQVDFLAVAYGDEGVALRKAGINTPILVLNPEETIMEALFRYDLEPEIYSLELLEQLIRHLPSKDQSTYIHLKLDTGMHRLGFEQKDVDALLDRLRQYPQIRVRSIFSHLAASDAPLHDDFSHRQIEVFQTIYSHLVEGLGYRPLRHILNTGGINRFPQYQMEMVRLGIGLYGIDSTQLIQDRLQTVQTLKASISQIKQVAAEETIGYQRNGKALRDMRIATISIGYADGLLRAAGNGRYRVLLHGKRVPIVGNVCMDMCMIDITELPEAAVGDEVVIFGAHLPVWELAQCLDTIPYEVFTNVSERVKRVYFQD